MIKVKVTLIQADILVVGKYSISEEACLGMIKRFKENTEPVLVRLGKTPLVIGKLVGLEYNKEKKELLGVIDLYMDFNAGAQILQQLDTPDGIRILDSKIKEITMTPGGKG